MTKNIKFIPYSFWEALKWLGKHIILDFYYPFIIVIFFMFITPVVTTLFIVVSPPWFYTFLYPFCFFVSLVIHQTIQIRQHKIENIGTLNADGWREFQFQNRNLVESKNLNQKKKVKYRIGFIGDIMRMRDYTLKFEERVKKFFNGVDLIVGNLEGIILIDKTKKDGIATQHHTKKILKYLRGIALESPQPKKCSKWLLCVSNNHSADFEEVDFIDSLNYINKKKNFYAFGDTALEEKHPAFPWDSAQGMDDINIVTGTMWTNKTSNNLISRFDDYHDKYKPNKFNIFYPHWHYENESYVRSEIQRKAIHLFLTGDYGEKNWNIIYNLLDDFSPFKNGIKRAWFQRNMKFFYKKPKKKSAIPQKQINQKWDLIFGHHSHVPQPIKDYGKGILGYSGGNFTSSERRKKHISGLIMKCEICESDDPNQLELGKVHWCYTRNERTKKKKEVSVIIDCKRTRKKYFESRSIKFRSSLIIFSIALGIWLGLFWWIGTINYLYWLIYSIIIVALFVYFGVKYSKFPSKK
ncbi:MAG: CapA family protein [Promethearchaeota archaeon]|jgi:hypothetical protein